MKGEGDNLKMSGFLFGLFIGVLVGVNIGLIILAANMSNWNLRDKLMKNREKKNAPEMQKKPMDPYETTVVHYCFVCNHKWREYPLLRTGSNFCPNCGRSLDDEGEEETIAVQAQ